MIDWLHKLPDSLNGAVIAGMAWFGFNYAVLAERAMTKDQIEIALPRCMGALGSHHDPVQAFEKSVARLTGNPQVDGLATALLQLALPRPLSPSEKSSRCACAARAARQALRFDYAVHTASFRLVSPQSAAAYSDAVMGALSSSACAIVGTTRGG